MDKKTSTPAASPARVTLQARELEAVIAPQGIIVTSALAATGPLQGIKLTNHNETLVVDDCTAPGRAPKRETLAPRELEPVIAPQGIIIGRR
jgi:hypothetical protein